MHSIEGIVKGQRAMVHVARISSYADTSLYITEELQGVLTTLKNHGEFQMEAIQAEVLNADSGGLNIHAKRVGYEESETI